MDDIGLPEDDQRCVCLACACVQGRWLVGVAAMLG